MAAWMLVGVVLVALVAVETLRPIAQSGPLAGGRTLGHAQPAVLPLAAQGPISAALGRAEPGYRIRGLRATNPAQQMGIAFSHDGVSVAHGATRVRLRLAGFGYGSALRPVRSATADTAGNRVLYQHGGGLSEWYANGPLGLEQGFEVATGPRAGAGPLRLSLAFGGDVKARLLGGAVSLSGHGGTLRYGGLVATDADGRRLPATLSLHGRRIVISVAARHARYPLRIDPFVQVANLNEPPGYTGDAFGYSTALSGTTIVVGAPGHKVGANASQGAVFVFTRPATGWANTTQSAMLTASDGAANDELGFTVATNGTTVVSGAPGHSVNGDADQGAVYVWVAHSGAWSQTQSSELVAPDGDAGNGYLPVAISPDGDTVVFGAGGQMVDGNVEQGEAYVATQPVAGWGSATPAVAELTAGGGGADDLFGLEVAASNDTVAVEGGQNGEGSEQGAIYVYTKTGGVWSSGTQQAELTAGGDPTLGVGSNSLVISSDGSTIAAGSPQATIGDNAEEGEIFVFDRPGSTWANAAAQSATLIDSSGELGDNLGFAVGISGNTIVAGGPDREVGGLSVGVLAVFNMPAAGWHGTVSQAQELTGSTTVGGGLGYSLGFDGTTIAAGTRAHQLGDFVFSTPQYPVSGTVQAQACGDETCSESPIADQDILLSGQTAAGGSFSAVDSSDSTGAWSILVPPGSYTATPVEDDDVTPVGAAFDPQSIPVTVASAAVPNQNFTACSGPADATAGAAGGRTAHAVGTAPRAVSGQFTEALCKAQYTLTVDAKITQSQIVDPALHSPYQHSTDVKEPSYLEGTGRVAAGVYNRALDSILEQYPKYPECYSEHAMEKLADEHVAMDWYTSMSGGDLGSVKIPLVWNAHTGAVSFNGAPSETPGMLKRTWHIIVLDDHKHRSCALKAQISPVAMVLPGGADAAGLVPKNAFTIVVLWYIPFDPGGEAPAPNTSAERFLKALLGDEHGEALVSAWESLPWPLRFGFLSGLGTGGVKGLEALAHLNKLSGAAKLAESLELLESIGHKLHSAHSSWDLAHFAESVAGVVGLMGEGDYPVMATVLRGSFDTQFSTFDTSNKYISHSTFGLSVKSTKFPDISVKITRQVQPNQSSLCPVGAGATQLPWAPTVAGCPIVTNPFARNQPSMVMQNHKSLARGTKAVKAIEADTRQFGEFKTHVRESGDLYSNFSVEQDVVPAPSCDENGDTGGKDKPNTAYTMCWVFNDGRP
jgi:hypothetical protein